MEFTFQYCELVSVVDADTMDFNVHLDLDLTKKVRVRLIGIDAPEKWTTDGNGCRANLVVKTAKYIPVSEYSKRKYFTIIMSPKSDKYGRRLGTVIDPDGNNLNEWSLKENNCVPYDGGKKVEQVKENSPKTE